MGRLKLALMDLIIDFDNITDPSKKKWLLSTLKLMGIAYHALEKPQTLDEYNEDLLAGDAEIECGDFKTAEGLKIEANKW
jgi:hypothetical protein